MSKISDTKETDDEAYYHAVEAAIQYGSQSNKKFTSTDLNYSIQHIHNLLSDAMSLFKMGSFGSSTFLAITSMEETAKIELLAMRSFLKHNEKKVKGRDPLRDHYKKHVLAVRETTFMGRLPKLIGEDACKRLQSEVIAGKFRDIRERALYVHLDSSNISTPKDAITEARAHEMLLLAIECADDILIGYTNQSYEFGDRFEELFAQLT